MTYPHRLKIEKEKGVPLHDRHMALALLLELALQRGTLQHILDTVLLLLRLSELSCKSNKVLKSEVMESCQFHQHHILTACKFAVH